MNSLEDYVARGITHVAIQQSSIPTVMVFLGGGGGGVGCMSNEFF